MKKILPATFLLVILLIILLILSGWYFHASAERAFRAYLLKTTEASETKIFRLELQHYQKTIFGAKATLKINSDYPMIAEYVENVELVAKLLNGPIFITKNGISTGSSRWFITMDESKLSDIEKESMRDTFPQLLPRAIIRTDFAKKVHYSAMLQTRSVALDVVGILDLATKDNTGSVLLQNLYYELFDARIKIEQISIDYQQQKAMEPVYKPSTIDVIIPRLVIEHKKFDNPIELTVEATGNISQTETNLDGFTKVTLKQLGHKEIPVDEANVTLMLKGVSSEGFLRYSQKQADLENLKQQAQWSLQEKGEFPEGQDQIWELYNEIEEKSLLLPSIILNEMFDEESLIQVKAESQGSSGKSELAGAFKSIETITPKSSKKGGGGFNTLVSVLQGEARIKLDKDLFQYIQNFSPLKQSEFLLILKDSKLLMQ